MTVSARDHTFVVCAYKESPYLESCLRSLVEQTMSTKIMVSTSTPNDHIRHLAAAYDVPVIEHEGPSGIGLDWNRALAQVETSLATIAHQDDVYLPRYAERILAGLNKVARPLIAFSNYGELRNGEAVDDSRLLRIKRILLTPLKSSRLARSVCARRLSLSLGSPICCPAVTYCLDRLPTPVFGEDMRCDLDWQAWERFSHLDGAFVYVDEVLMRHRIHEGSETSALIQDNTRSREDLEMFQKFWPAPIARVLNRVYAGSQASNALDV